LLVSGRPDRDHAFDGAEVDRIEIFGSWVNNVPAQVRGGCVTVCVGHGPKDILKLSATASCTIVDSMACLAIRKFMV
jgi:hypothetical protein